MGLALSNPVVSQVVWRRGDPRVRIGACCMQGYRAGMEDAHVLEFRDNPQADMVLGVFDGHGGYHASKFCEENVMDEVESLDSYKPKKLKKILENIDKEFVRPENSHRGNGTTAVMAIVEFDEGPPTGCRPACFRKNVGGDGYLVHVINCGDSRCLTGRRGHSEIDFVTVDHKPVDPKERKRIERNGGFVENGRVNGNLAVSRAIGDWNLKSHKLVIPTPDIYNVRVQEGDYLLLACDGIFEEMSVKDVGVFIKEKMDEFKDPNDIDPGYIAQELIRTSLTRGSTDNMSVVLAVFVNGDDYGAEPEYVVGDIAESRQTMENARLFAELYGFVDQFDEKFDYEEENKSEKIEISSSSEEM